MKKNKEVKFRHKVVTAFFKPIVRVIITRKYNLKITKNKDLKEQGPFLILGNHTVPTDPMVMGLGFPFPLYYFATEQIFNLGLISKALLYGLNPIKKSKSISDLTSIRKAKKIVLEGGSVAVFPEGNLTYDGQTSSINKSIVKLIRLLGVPVVIYKTSGLYLSNPRWSLFNKKGKTKAFIDRIIYKDEYNALDDDALYELIKEALYVNAYDDQLNLPVTYRGKKIAHGLERLIFMDLDQNIPFVTFSKNNLLLSTKSNFQMQYNLDGSVSYNNSKYNLVELNKMVIESYINYLDNSSESFLFTELSNLHESTSVKKINLKKYRLNLYKHKISLIGKNEIELNFEEVANIAIQGKKKLIVYTQEKTYLITLDKNSSPYKYLLTYQNYKLKQKEDEANGEIYQFGL